VRGDTHHDEDSPRWMKMTRELSIQSQKAERNFGGLTNHRDLTDVAP
jgi:hypothetical protein